MRKTLTYGGFVITSLLVVTLFLTSKSYTQLIIAIAIYPVLAYFAFKISPRKVWKAPVVTVRLPIKSFHKETKAEKTKREKVAIEDIDRRAFLKLVGGVGLSVFLFSFFNQKLGRLFSGSNIGASETAAVLKDTAGNKIDPTQAQPTDGYRITEVDDGIVTFFGFTNKEGAWFIMREDTDLGTFRYVKGSSNFPGNWNGRDSLSFDYYNNVF